MPIETHKEIQKDLVFRSRSRANPAVNMGPNSLMNRQRNSNLDHLLMLRLKATLVTKNVKQTRQNKEPQQLTQWKILPSKHKNKMI